MPDDNTTTTTIKYGDFTYGPADLPEKSALYLMQKGLTHFMGNEVASKMAAWKEKNPEGDVKAQTAVFLAEADTKLREGTVGIRTGGGGGGRSADPIETMARRIATREVLDVLKSKGLKAPKGDATISLGGETRTMAQMVANRLAKFGERITAEARKAVAAAAKKAETVAAGATGESASDLGL